MRKTAFLLFLILLLSLAAQAPAEVYLDREPPADWADKPVLRLTAFATVSNDCALLEVGGRSMLIDGGVRKWRTQLTEALAELGHEGYVDILYNTHPHDDHLEGVTYMINEGFRAEAFWSTFPTTYRNDIQKDAVRALENAGIPYHQLAQEETVDFGGATLVFRWWEAGRDPNSRSSVLHVTFGDATLLLTADATGAAQRGLMADFPEESLRADIMKLPHHGLVPSVADFIRAVDPAFVYITNRKSSIPRSIAQLDGMDIPWLVTSMGRIVMVTDGTDWYVKQYRDLF